MQPPFVSTELVHPGIGMRWRAFPLGSGVIQEIDIPCQRPPPRQRDNFTIGETETLIPVPEVRSPLVWNEPLCFLGSLTVVAPQHRGPDGVELELVAL